MPSIKFERSEVKIFLLMINTGGYCTHLKDKICKQENTAADIAKLARKIAKNACISGLNLDRFLDEIILIEHMPKYNPRRGDLE